MPETKKKGGPIPPVENKKKVSPVGMGIRFSFYARLILLSSSFYKKVLFDPFPFFGFLATHALFITTGVTHFVLFTRAGVYGFLLFTVCGMVGNVAYMRKLLSALYLIDPDHLNPFSRFEVFIDPFFSSLLFFDFLILSLVLTNTTALHIPQVNERIKRVYGEKFLADRGYNPPFQSLVRAWNMNGTLWAAFTGAFTATILFFIYQEIYLYGKWYHLYAEAYMANANRGGTFSPPCTTKGFVAGLFDVTLHHF
jgi:hypothetical protein